MVDLPSLRHSRVIGDQPDFEPAQRAKTLRNQDVDAALHAIAGQGGSTPVRRRIRRSTQDT